MKKKYTSPEFDIFELNSEDFLSASTEVDSGDGTGGSGSGNEGGEYEGSGNEGGENEGGGNEGGNEGGGVVLPDDIWQ